MPANVQSMAYYGEEPWHGLGTMVEKGLLAKGMIRAAGMDWEVVTRPARGAEKINRKGEYSRYEVIRVPRAETGETEVLLGVVSRRYKPLQNAEAFEFFNPLIGEEKAYFETAGALGQGERIWVMAKLPGVMEIVSGDECYRYLLLSNTHSGDGSVMVKFTSVRVVCQNTLMLALEDGQKAYRVRHSKRMQSRLDELAEFLNLTQNVFMKAEECFRRLAQTKMTQERIEAYFDAVFPQSKTQKERGEEPTKWDHLYQVLHGRPDLQMPGVRDTLWGAYNAVTRFEDYKQPPNPEQPEQRLERAWFGGGADIKVKALEKAVELAGTWR